MLKFTTFITALLCLTAHAKKLPDTYSPSQIVTYKKTDKSDLKLDIFNPKDHKPSDKKPAIIFFFGGGWVGGSTKQFHPHAGNFASQGYVAICADYRTSISPFICVEDGKSAIRWIRAHADELGINPGQIIAAGGSAGGHVAACSATIDGFDLGENLNKSSKPNALILFNPVIDTTEKGFGLKAVGEKRKTEISPCHHVKKGIVPTLIFHGTADTTVPFENVERFTKLMKDAGNQCTLIPYENQGHGFFNSTLFKPGNDPKIFQSTLEHSHQFLIKLGFQNKPKQE